eukprot:COSAG02_NODE_9524_length_2189_cov_7.382430_1_plen_150_part_10
MALAGGRSRAARLRAGKRQAEGTTLPPTTAASPVSPVTVDAEVGSLLDSISPPPSAGPVRPTATAASPTATKLLPEDVEQRFEALARQNEQLLSELASVKLISSSTAQPELLPSTQVEAGADEPPPQPPRVDLDQPDGGVLGELEPGGAP